MISKNKKICFFSGNISGKGGTERVTVLLANELKRKGFDISILTFSNKGESYFKLDDSIKIYHLYEGEKNALLNYPRTIFKLRNFFKKERIDVIVDVDVILSMNTLPAKIGLKTKVISWEHFNFYNTMGIKRREWSRQLAAKYSDMIITLTQEDLEYYKKNLDIKTQIEYIHNPTPFENVEKSQCNSKIAIAVGGLTKVKGFDRLLKIWKQIECKDQEWELQIIGSGEEKIELLKMIEKLEIKRARLIEHADAIESHYKKASMYLMTSKFEGLPMTLIEAQSFGLPIISYDIKTGPRDIVVDSESGFLIEDDKEKEFVQKFLELSTNSEKIMQFSKNAYDSSKKFKRENILKKWEQILEEI